MTRTITNNRTVYVGNLPGDVREREIEDLFYKYGRIVDIDLKLPPRPPGYAFVEFADARDAEDAIRGRDGYDFDGSKLRVELAHGGRGSSRASSHDRYNHYNSGVGRPTGVSRRSEYRVIVTGLPASASWQDLKDHMRRAGDVCFAQVFRDGNGAMGIVDYTNYDDMKYAIRKLDDSEFRNPFARGYIRIREHKDGRSYSRSRSRSYSRSKSRSSSRSRSRSFSRSRSRSRRSYSRSYSRSPSKGRSKSVSRSRSKSPQKNLDKKSRSASPAAKATNLSRERSRSRSISGSPEIKKDITKRNPSPVKEKSPNPITEPSGSREKSLSPAKSPRSGSPDKISRSRSGSPRRSPVPDE